VHIYSHLLGANVAQTVDEKLLITVAKLYYEEGKSQAEVAQLLDASQAKVSRLLGAARSRGIIRITVAQFEPRDADLESQLRRRFSLRHAIVIATPIKSSPPQVRGMVGHAAAPMVAELIHAGTIVGVAGGRTLHQVINWVKPEEPKGVRVVQLMGSIEATVSELDAMELGRVLAGRMRGTFHALNAPAIVADRTTRDVFLANSQISGVCEFYRNVDVALVGVGSPGNSVFVSRGVLSEDNIEYLRKRGAVGEICGRFFDASGQECDTAYRDRVIGIDLDRLRSIEEVVGVVTGADRAAAVRAAIHGKLLKSLVIDQVGAEAVLAVDGAETSP
jgi:deoxyribonucleoside regulator